MNWSRPTDSGSTENARLENRKLFKIHFKLLYLRFPPLQIRTCVFRTCVFSRPFWICNCVKSLTKQRDCRISMPRQWQGWLAHDPYNPLRTCELFTLLCLCHQPWWFGTGIKIGKVTAATRLTEEMWSAVHNNGRKLYIRLTGKGWKTLRIRRAVRGDAGWTFTF